VPGQIDAGTAVCDAPVRLIPHMKNRIGVVALKNKT
jgi:hypothetical protein